MVGAIRGNVDQLSKMVELIKFVSDDKQRMKFIADIEDHLKDLKAENAKLTKAHGGVRKLQKADEVLAAAQEEAQTIIAKAQAIEDDANHKLDQREKSVKDRERKVGQGEADLIDRIKAKNDDLQRRHLEADKREASLTTRENRLATRRANLDTDLKAWERKTAALNEALRA